MFRVRGLHHGRKAAVRGLHMTGADVRKTFLEYFTDQGHVAVRSSSVVPLCDPTVPFVNAGMNQFKGVFLGRHAARYPRVVNSQKCIRVGGKHNDLAAVGTDGTHHTFFEMLGNWSFGDYYKTDACKLAWELLTGPYRLRAEDLIVTYFGGDPGLGLPEDLETRDVWRQIGVQRGSIKPLGLADNFWEMGATGPCGPCTEIHICSHGNLIEIWNLVFIQYERQIDGSVVPLPKQHVDTGMGLERATALLQGALSNYDTDLFLPIIAAIEKESKQAGRYSGKFGLSSELDCAYRCLADHSRMIAVCLADGMFPASSLNLKQIMRRSFKLSEDVFKCKIGLLSALYERVADILGPTYPELYDKMAEAKTIIDHEEASYAKLRSNLIKKWKDLVTMYPEVEILEDVELPGFAEGYKQFKQAMTSVDSDTIPGDLVFKMYDTHGFSDEIIDRVAQLNNYSVDRHGFQQLLNKHKSRHKSSFKEQSENNRALLFDQAIEKLNSMGVMVTNDDHKYNYEKTTEGIVFPELKTNVVAILNSKCEWTDTIDVNNEDHFYIVTKDTNFYTEEGGQVEDRGKIVLKDICLNCVSVFKIRNIVFHKVIGTEKGHLNINDRTSLNIDGDRRMNCMRNHTATHLLNAAIRKVLNGSVSCQVGSSVTENGLVFNMAVYGDRLSAEVMTQVQEMVRQTIAADLRVQTWVTDAVELGSLPGVVTVPGETYPDTGIRVVQIQSDELTSRELCCGTHVPRTGDIGDFCVTSVKGAGGNSPVLRAITGAAASELIALTSDAERLYAKASSWEPRRLESEATAVREAAARLAGPGGAPVGQLAECLKTLDKVQARVKERDDITLNDLAEQEMRDQLTLASQSGRPFVVHFLVCSYLMESASLAAALRPCVDRPAMVIACANGVMKVACCVPESRLTKQFTAEKWLSCVLPVFKAKMISSGKNERVDLFAAMVGTKVSLITCEGLVRDAMKLAIAFAEAHTRSQDDNSSDNEQQLGRWRS